MNRWIYIISIIISIFSCDTPKENQLNSPNKNSKQEQPVFIVKKRLKSSNILDSLMIKEKNLQKFIHNLRDSIYTLELLKDRTTQNISNVHPLTFIKTNSILDTAAIRSRFVLTEVHLKKLDFLINKKKIEKDTVEKTLNQIVSDVNHIIDQMEIYQNHTDEFEEILKYDSIKHDTIIFNDLPVKNKKIPKKILRNIKNLKLPEKINKKRKK